MSHPVRLVGLGLVLSLGACVVVSGDGESARVAGFSLSDDCGAAERQDYVGQRVDVLNSAQLPDATRVLLPGMSATGEADENRLTISVDGSDTITRVYCG